MAIGRCFFITLLMLASVTHPGLSGQTDPSLPGQSRTPGSFQEWLAGKNIETYALPIEGLVMVQTRDKMFLVSSNNRFLIRGQIYDLWNGTFIDTVEDARRFSDRIRLSSLKLDSSEFGAFVVGKGTREVVVFVDPHCPYCHRLLEQISALEKDYRFRIVLVPVLGDRSAQTIKQLLCGLSGKDRDKKGFSYLVSGQYEDLPNKDCEVNPLVRNMIVAKLLGLSGVPFVIAPDGRILRGYVEDLKVWLEQQEQKS